VNASKPGRLASIAALAATALALWMPQVVVAQTAEASKWPTRLVKIRVGFPPGGTTDVLARVIGQKLQDALGVPVVIENRAGAVGSLDASILAKAAPDDHVFMMVPPGIQAINQFLYQSVGYDAEKDFVTVGLVAQCPNVLAVHPALPFTTFQGLVAYAKANPTKLNYSISGVGASGHLLTELVKSKTGISMQYVPYKGNGPALMALVGGEVQVNTDCNPQLLQYVKSGKVRALAVSSDKRWDELPDVPTFAELGYPDLTMQVWYALIAQAKTPKEVVARMNRELNAVLKQPEVVAHLREMNLSTLQTDPAYAAAFVTRERDRWKEIVRISGARLE